MNIKTNIVGTPLVFGTFEGYKTSHITVKELEKFANLIVLKCAQIVENEATQYVAPVWAVELINDMHEHFDIGDIPLYTKQEWQGLTDEELREMLGYGKGGYIAEYTRNFVNAIEAKLREKNT